MIVKVVYFDEGSATDYLHIDDGGQAEEKTENIKNTTTKLVAKASASAEAKFNWFPFFGASAAAESSAEAARLGNTIISKAISNTILTDYLDKVENKKEGDIPVIDMFKNYNLIPYPESFAYIKMMTPYFIMAEGKFESDGISLNVARMDEALESGRGYYELIAEENENRYILRFNIKAFRNNYGIADLVKMKLIYHAIEVGVFPESKLAMKAEFSEVEANYTGIDLVDDDGDSELPPGYLKVFDVILAGVEK